MNKRLTILVLPLLLTACDELLSAADPSTCEDTQSQDVGGDSLSDAEWAALESWTPRTVSFSPSDGSAQVLGDRITVRVADTEMLSMDLTTRLASAQDYNSSRSNRTGIVALDEGAGGVALRWDGGEACASLPCVSEAARPGQTATLSIERADDSPFGLSWASSTPMDQDFSGQISLGYQTRHRGHVTVLKASEGGGDVYLSSELEITSVSIYDGDKRVSTQDYVDKSSAIILISGAGGGSWPSGLRVEPDEGGALISLTWDSGQR